MKALVRFSCSVLCLALMTGVSIAQKVSNGTKGNWSSTTTWVGGAVPGPTDNVVIADGDSVTIDADFTVASLTVGQGTSGMLIFDTVAVRTTVVTGNVTIASGGIFSVSPLTNTKAHSLSIAGDLVNNGTFDMSRLVGFSATAVCNVTFNNTSGNQNVTGSTPFITRFRGIALSKGAVGNEVLCNIGVSKSGSSVFVLTAGTWEQTADTLTFSNGNETLSSANGSLVISGTGNFSDPGASLTISGGNITCNTSGSFLQGSGNNSTTISSGTLNFTSGTVTLNGKLVMSGGTTTINGANITINQQGTNNASTGNNAFDLQAAANFTMSSGSVIFGSPNAASSDGTRSGRDLKIAAPTTGVYSITGGTFYIGDGGTTPVSGGATGYTIAVTAPSTLLNLVIQGGGVTGRNAMLTSNLTLNGTLTMISGSLNLNSKTITYGPSSTLKYGGAAAQTTSGELTSTVNNLTVDDPAGVTLAGSTSVTNTLTLTNGTLAVAGNSLTLKNPVVVTSGNLATSNSSSIIIAGSASGINIPGGAAELSKLTVNNANGTTLQGPLTVDTTLTFTSGKIITGANTLTLGPSATVAGAGAGLFVDGAVARVISAAAALTWPTGLGTNYLPVTLYVKTVTSSGALTIQVLDKGTTPFTGVLNASTQVLSHYIHTSGNQSLNIAVDSVAVSYLASDLPGSVYASDLQVIRWNGYPWLSTAARIDSVGDVLYPKQNIGGGDYVVTGAGGLVAPSMTALNFGTVLGGDSKTDTVVVTNTGNRSLSIDSVRTTLSEFMVVPTSSAILPGATDTFKVTYAPLTAGSKFGSVVFYNNGLSARDTVQVTGGVQIFAGFSASKDTLDFGTIGRNTSKIDSVFVTNVGNAALVVDSIRSSDGSFGITPPNATVPAGNSQKFTVTYHPTTIGAKSGVLRFFSNSSTQPDTIWVKGDVLLAPVFSVSKTSLNYGLVLTGQSKKDSVVVKNPGTATLTISSVVSTNSDFAVTPTSGDIAMDDSLKFYVTFTPSIAGAQGAKIAFNHNATTKDTIFASGNSLTLGSVKDARLAANGTEVLFEAIVTRAKGNYTYLQDTSAGMNVYQSSSAWHDSVASGGIRAGDKIRVDGRTSEYNSLKEISAGDLVSFTILSRNNTVPTPALLTLSQIAANGEKYESELVKVVSVTVSAGSATTYVAATTYSITDPSDNTGAVSLRIPNAGDSDVDGTTIIPLITFTGVVGQFSSSNAAAGYQLMAVNASDVTDNSLSAGDAKSGIPETYQLHNNYPNPFNPSTTILYDLPYQSRVTLKVYSILGQEVRTLLDGDENAGFRSIQWNGRDNNGMQVSSGVYFFRINAQPFDGKAHAFSQVRKMLLMK